MTLLIAVFGAGAVAAPVAAAPAAADITQTTEDAEPTGPAPEDAEPTDPAPEDTAATEPAPDETPSSEVDESPSSDVEESAGTADNKEEPAPEAGSITPLSTGPGTSWIQTGNTFFAYVGAGENLDITFAKHARSANSTDAEVTVRGPGSAMETCTALATDGAGSGCSWTDLAPGTPGIWQIDFTPVGDTSDFYDWTIDVQDGSDPIPGRVYSERYGMSQRSAETSGVTLWYQSEQGFQYRADYNDYNGINSSFASDATGVAELDTCVSAYRSMQADFGPNSDAASLWVPPAGECGDPYKIFFESPSTSLPATAELWDGTTQWLQPPVTLPTLDNLAFTRNSPSTSAGEFTFDVADFTGQLTILIDANDDGDYTDAVDTTVPAAVTQDGTVTVAFDGLDGQGDPISSTQTINARVAITQAGEIHFVNGDVETRDGLQVEALNGPDVGSSTLYWDDTDLETDGRICQTPELDGTAGVDSTGGVHGWPCADLGAANANDGENGSWGDTRNIDDWTYHTINEFEELQIPGVELPPFQCSSDAYLFQYAASGPPTSVFSVDMVTGKESPFLTIDGREINGVAYNPVDDYVYGWDNTNDEIVRIGSDGNVEGLTLPDNWPTTMSDTVNVADFDENGTLWLAAGGADTTDLLWASIDLNPGSSTYFDVLDSGVEAIPGSGNVSDWAFSTADGGLYSLIPGTNGTDKLLVRFDMATGALSVEENVGQLTAPDGTSPNSNFGAVYADAEGFVYAQDNFSGQIWRMDPTTGAVDFFAYGPTTELNDGARCVLAPTPIDFGDAPDEYGTLLADDGPRHAIPGYDPDASTAPVMLGSSIDIETDGQPDAAADGDDTTGVADEDGVAFNPALGYPNPTLRTGVDPTSLQPIENTLEVEASADGFVSVWVDWNVDGDFDDAGEQVASAEAVTAGVNDITFAQGTNPPDIETYVRVRYSTDDTAIADPTGPAPDGEVEDYQVLVERLVQPDVCVDTGNEYYAFTFDPPAPADLEGTGGPGSSVRFRDVAVVEGVPVDLFIETISGTMNANQAPPNGYRSGDGVSFGADDAQWQVATNSVLRYTFYEAGTDDPTPVNAVFTINDMDDHGGGRIERATFSAADLASYAVTQGSAVTITETGGNVEFTGNANSAGAPESRFQIVLDGVDTMDVGWTGFGGSGYGFDGDKDLAIDPACEDFGDAPDTYSTTLADDGPRHTIVPGLLLGSEIDFDADGRPSAAADGDDANRLADEDGVADEVVVTVGDETTVTVSATNTTADDATLAGWIDLDGNGTFDAGELVTAAVPAGSGTADYDLTFPAGTTTADTYARFRLFPGTVADADASPVGSAAAGEVEDYPVTAVPLPPFQCTSNAPGLLFQNAAAAPTDVNYVDLVTGEYTTPLTVVDHEVNATGYNVQDDYVYGWSLDRDDPSNNELVRIGGDGNAEPLGVPTGMSAADVERLYVVGDVDDNGHYWMLSGGTWVDIDLATMTATTGDAATPAGFGGGVDWAFVPGTNELWRVVYDASDQAYLIGFDRTSHDWTTPVELTGLAGLGNAGAVFVDADGFLYASFNASGEIWRVDVNAETAAFFSDGPDSSGNDGARCADSPILVDFADAPAGYDTELGDDGPRHGIQDYDESAGTAPLMLGAAVDFETDGQPSSAADGDAADEDGVGDAIEVEPGLETTVRVSATNNTGEAATLAGWVDLDGSGTFDAGELVTAAVPAGSGTADYDLDFPAGTVTADTFARFRLFPGVVADADALPTGPAAAGEVEDYLVTVLERELEVEKTSDATEDSRPGDVVTYTVTARNTGTADYTTENPAVVLDDLSGVLDDAAYNNDAQASDGPAPSYADPLISWVGELPAGQAVTIEYTVTLATGGDGEVRNVAFGPECDPADADCDTTTPECDPPQDGVDPDTGLPCAETELLLPHLEHTKVADTTELPEDDAVVNYTITVENVGPGVFTDTAPGTLTDDLSAVLDDGTYNGDVSVDVGAVTFDQAGESIEWEGALGVADTATITYSVTYDSSTGDNRLLNVACVPTELAADPADPCRTVEIPGSDLQESKTVNPVSGTSVVAGQDVIYTLQFENTGEADATVDTFDDLSNVLDDAALTGGPTSSDPALTAVLNGDQIDITGTVPVGATYTVDYTVTVDAFADQGDHVLGNVLGEDCLEVDPTCRTTNPVRHLSVEKTSDAAADVNTGDTVTYTVTVTNDGEGDYTAQTPAVAQDDLAGVLDDATYNGDASASAGTVSYAAPVLTWTGALAAGDSETFTYTVTVSNAGDHLMENVAGPVCEDPEVCDPPVTVVTELPHIVPDKSSNPASGEELLAGDVVTYTLSWTNDGEAEGPVDSTDDLSDILDDGDVTSEPVSSDPAVTAVRTDDQIRVTGTLQPGQSVTVVYEVTIKADGERGDNIAGNVLTPDVPPQVCADDAEDCEEFPPPTTEHPIGELEDWKSVDPASGGTVQPGEEVTYTLHFENTGEADVPVDRDDVLTQVLDDATLTTTAASSDPALTVSQLTGDRFTITGTLTPGQVVTVTYTVTVNADGDRGDDRLGNFLVPTGQEPPEECEPADDERADCTVNHVSNVVASKTADPASGTEVDPGQDVTYTLTFDNVSTNPDAAPAPIEYTDHLGDVLDDAELTDEPVASSPDVDATTEDEAILITGSVASGETVTITYTVTVDEYDAQDNHHLGNVLAVTGEDPVCAEDSDLCTSHDLVPPPTDPDQPPFLPDTGTDAWIYASAAILLTLTGALILATRRRNAD